MIVSDSDVLIAALDRRMQVGRVTAPPASPSLGDGTDAPRETASSRSDPSLAARLPLGQVIAARIVGLSEAGDPIAEIAGLRVALSWPGPGQSIPMPGDRVALRVLAHVPTLLFESASFDANARDGLDPALHLSVDARSLQSAIADAGPLRFTAPILVLERASSGVVDEANRTTGPVQQEPFISAAQTLGVVLPLVLQGPAWPGQDVEIVVRRERSDDVFENAALDQWCGEIVIDLPTLGRVSGHLAWSIRGLRIRLEGQDDASVASMTATTAELATALSAVDMPVIALSVGRLSVDASQVDRG